jgi:DUF438 domain-containing protein
MSIKRWDELLVAEHEMIERAMDIMRRELEKLPQGQVDQFAMRRTLDFLLEFGDRIHNTKEEKWLFPLLTEKGIPEDGPIRVMLMEHENERALLADMMQKTTELPGMPTPEKALFKQAGLQYLEIRADHIWKENDVLYAMGRRDFSEQDNTDLVEAFNQYTASIYGPDFAAIIEKMLAEVEQGGAARKSMIENLSYAQLDAIMETLPVEVTFVDADDAVAYFNRLDKDKIFVRSRSVIGRKVLMCHPAKSVDQVKKIVAGFKDGSLDKAEFWLDMGADKIYIRYFPVRNSLGEYMGVLEVTQEIGAIQKITGQKRLL